MCDPAQPSRLCEKSQIGGHCNVDNDCVDNAYCSQQWHVFSQGIGGIDAAGYCVNKLAPTIEPTSQPTSCPIGYFVTDSSVIPCTCDEVPCGSCMTGCYGSLCQSGGSRNMCGCEINPYRDCGDPWVSCGKVKPACSPCPYGYTTVGLGATSSTQCVPIVPSETPTLIPSPGPTLIPSETTTLIPSATKSLKPSKKRVKKSSTKKPTRKRYIYRTHSPSRKQIIKI